MGPVHTGLGNDERRRSDTPCLVLSDSMGHCPAVCAPEKRCERPAAKTGDVEAEAEWLKPFDQDEEEQAAAEEVAEEPAAEQVAGEPAAEEIAGEPAAEEVAEVVPPWRLHREQQRKKNKRRRSST